ncbi:MAG: leucine-rich repeat domain-containing protein [Clostridia bacterium]|nr:leucine-rich repeat domain-containing protein [Clostridia bacterium]
MKNRIALLVLALVCLIGLFAMTATADEAPTASIAGHNLSLNDNIYIIYYAEFENLPVGAEKGVLVWTSQQESYEYGTQYAILPVYTGNNYDYDAYYFTGVSAKMMTQDIYAKAYVKVGDEITYSELDKYSVLQYCYNKKDSTTTLDDSTITLGELIQDILHYGASAQKYFNFNTDRLATADYYEIKVVNGMLPDTTKSGLFQLSEQVTLTASIENFDHWENLAGETVGTEATLVVTVAGAETYTAIEKGPELVYSEGLEFVSNGDGTCYVAGIGTCTDTDIRIPPVSPEGDSVTSIGYRAFRDCKALTSITIPNSVTSIGYYAFQYCTSLTSIEIPDSVTSIGSSVFSGCSALQSMTIPFVGNRAGVTAEDTYQYPFGYLFGTSYTDGTETTQYYYGSSTSSTIFSDYYIPTSLKSVTVTGGYIPYGAFYNCSNLTSVTLGDSVTSIGRYAFCRSSSLTSVTIGNSVTSIGEYAFYNCSSLTSIEIPAGVTSIERYAFEGCSNLQYNTYSKAKYLGNAENPYVVLMNATNTSITSCKIHSNTKIIYGYAFQNCDSLTSVTIGDSVTSIGDSVFRGCSSLTSIEIPDGVTSIGNYAFYYCSSLTSIEIPDSVTSIGDYAFSGCTSLTSIEIPDKVTSIGDSAFRSCSSLTSVEIPGSVTSIGRYAFSGCTSLTSNEIPDSVTSI